MISYILDDLITSCSSGLGVCYETCEIYVLCSLDIFSGK